MRAAYGPAWGVASAALIPDDTARSKAVGGVAAAVWGFELAALPLT